MKGDYERHSAAWNATKHLQTWINHSPPKKQNLLLFIPPFRKYCGIPKGVGVLESLPAYSRTTGL